MRVVYFFVKFILAFIVSFILLAVPLSDDRKVFHELDEITLPLTTALYDGIGSLYEFVMGQIGEVSIRTNPSDIDGSGVKKFETELAVREKQKFKADHILDQESYNEQQEVYSEAEELKLNQMLNSSEI